MQNAAPAWAGNTRLLIKRHTYFVHTVVKESQAGVLIADEGALLDEADEHLRFGHQRVELLVRAVAALQEPWTHRWEEGSRVRGVGPGLEETV